MEYTVYTNKQDLATGQANGENVLVVRKCSECGDNLLGLPGTQYDSATCEEGYHGNRPGVYYSNGQTITIPDDKEGAAIHP